MAGENTTGAAAAQAAGTAQPQAGTTAGGQEPQAPAGQEPDGAQTDPGTEADPARSAAIITELRKEQAANRKKLKALEDEKAQADAAKLTDEQRREKENADLKADNARLAAELAELGLQGRTATAAAKLGFRDPELAYRLIDRTTLELGEDGVPTNLDAVLKALLQKSPYLGSVAGVDYGGGQRGKAAAGEPGMNELLKAAAGR